MGLNNDVYVTWLWGAGSFGIRGDELPQVLPVRPPGGEAPSQSPGEGSCSAWTSDRLVLSHIHRDRSIISHPVIEFAHAEAEHRANNDYSDAETLIHPMPPHPLKDLEVEYP